MLRFGFSGRNQNGLYRTKTTTAARVHTDLSRLTSRKYTTRHASHTDLGLSQQQHPTDEEGRLEAAADGLATAALHVARSCTGQDRGWVQVSH